MLITCICTGERSFCSYTCLWNSSSLATGIKLTWACPGIPKRSPKIITVLTWLEQKYGFFIKSPSIYDKFVKQSSRAVFHGKPCKEWWCYNKTKQEQSFPCEFWLAIPVDSDSVSRGVCLGPANCPWNELPAKRKLVLQQLFCLLLSVIRGLQPGQMRNEAIRKGN